MVEFLKGLSPQIQAAIIAAVAALATTLISFSIKSWIARKILINKLESEYKYE